MTEYEKSRVRLQILHIIATLGVPFMVVVLNEYLRSDSDKRRENTPIIVKCVSASGASQELVRQSQLSIKTNPSKYDTEWSRR